MAVSVFFPAVGRSLTSIAVMGKDLEYFSDAGFDMSKIHLKRNAPVAQLYEDAVRYEGKFPAPRTFPFRSN